MTTISLAELAQHNKKGDVWVAIHGSVYDITNFMDDHPGGEEVLLEQAGQDATEAFEDIGHSEEARETLRNLLVGRLEGAPQVDTIQKNVLPSAKAIAQDTEGNAIRFLLVVATIAGLVAYQWFT
jgi:cytochrome b involved in lipid metabolism